MEYLRYYCPDYNFKWLKEVHKFRMAGYCNWEKKIVSLSPVFVDKNKYSIIVNTILHEVAHAMRPKHGHNKYWRKTAVEIGCTGKRCYSSEVVK